jgi:uncharacterized protein (DUF952 family)
MLIYKILTGAQWAALERDGETAGAPVDLADGFVHFSTRVQVAETAAKHFTGQAGLMVLAVEADGLGEALKWEPSRGGALFPHLYAPLRLADVVWSKPLPLSAAGVHAFPTGMTG